VAYTAADGDVGVAGTTTVTYTDGSITTAADASFTFARFSQQMDAAVTTAAASSLVAASLAALVVTDNPDNAVAPASSDDSPAVLAETTVAPTSDEAPQTESLLTDTGTTETPPAQGHEAPQADDAASHLVALDTAAADHMPAAAGDAAGGDLPAHFAAAVVFDTPASVAAMEALLIAPGQGAQPAAPAVADAAQPVIGEVLAEGNASTFVDALLDHVVGHDAPANADAPQSIDLAAILAAHVDGGAGAAPAPLPVMDFDHAAAEMMAAVHA
jgi:hypothetical protein